MKQFITGVLVALLATAIYSCTTSSNGGGSPVLFKINGRGVNSEEFLASEPVKEALRNFLAMEAMKNEAKRVGAVVDEKELQKEVEDYKKNITLGGTSWEQFLKESQMTEKEFIEQRRTQMLFPAMLKKKIKVTDEEIKKAWDDDKQGLIEQYAAMNKLPDSEKAKITFEQVKDLAKERVEQGKMGMVQGEVMSDIISNAKLDLTSFTDQTKAKRVADQIMKPLRDMADASKKQSEMARKAAGEEIPEEAAEGDKAAEGGEAAAEGEAVPHDHDGDGVSDHGDEAHEQGGESAPEGEGEGGGE